MIWVCVFLGDVQLSDKVVDAMQMQVSAERKKRARVLESEGMREAVVNQVRKRECVCRFCVFVLFFLH